MSEQMTVENHDEQQVQDLNPEVHKEENVLEERSILLPDFSEPEMSFQNANDEQVESFNSELGVDQDQNSSISSEMPLVERSILFDFTMLPAAAPLQPQVQRDINEDVRLDSETEAVVDEEPLTEVEGEAAATKINATFELEEHLKMLCDAELIEQIQAIPKRISFKIGEVADLVGVKSFVLRFWETEFDLLKPKKASNNQRMYSKKDVEVGFLIKKLLYRDRFSIEGARNVIKQARNQLKTEVSKYDEVVTTKQKMESLVKLQQEKIALLKSKTSEVPTVKADPIADALTIKAICENVDQISARVSQLKSLFY